MNTDYINQPINEEHCKMIWKAFGHVPTSEELRRLKEDVIKSRVEYERQMALAQFEARTRGR